MNRTYENCKLIIESNRYTYDDMFNKIDLFLMVGRITEAEYVELTGLLTPPEPTPEPEPTDPVTPVEPPAETPSEEPETPVEETV
ncbi:hypothetical protein PMZ73_17025 [[Clostridium] symbiosum]|uniref:XkdX family protein n=1 Tax=Clostridium symbiosum TaxID=1512 RepID=A0AAW6AYC3_CLOSY|nr:hypothetical protein [[Clostridium] symbiosum]MDB1979292.1 hypothetical protein [[Clostridium] symbiosum]MDB1983846.1 hypothetical protein [[Clostridium] symbiosum]MDB1985487.1 hypothetical protein [[Clostridium] symbiosum]MDB1990139.1 hypothetical protein [[Clostridium] symbiosum]MDB1994650.1 hypothetical protein [[Clostridium] symbiosum]